jgi:O-antigen ligase
VQEEITWFSWKKTPQALTQLAVTGPRVANVQSAAERTKFRVPFAPLGRLTLWRAALLIAQDYPLLGIGPDNFRRQFGTYVGLARWDTNIHANNLYLEWLADGGVLGLAAFLWLGWRLLRTAGGQVQRAGQSESRWIWQLALTASLLTWFVHGLFDYFYEFTPTYVAFWLVAGLTLRVNNYHNGEIRQNLQNLQN